MFIKNAVWVQDSFVKGPVSGNTIKKKHYWAYMPDFWEACFLGHILPSKEQIKKGKKIDSLEAINLAVISRMSKDLEAVLSNSGPIVLEKNRHSISGSHRIHTSALNYTDGGPNECNPKLKINFEVIVSDLSPLDRAEMSRLYNRTSSTASWKKVGLAQNSDISNKNLKVIARPFIKFFGENLKTNRVNDVYAIAAYCNEPQNLLEVLETGRFNLSPEKMYKTKTFSLMKQDSSNYVKVNSLLDDQDNRDALEKITTRAICVYSKIMNAIAQETDTQKLLKKARGYEQSLLAATLSGQISDKKSKDSIFYETVIKNVKKHAFDLKRLNSNFTSKPEVNGNAILSLLLKQR